jgi:hypothetical protein
MTVRRIISFLGTRESMEFSHLDSIAPKNSWWQRLSGTVKHWESWTQDDDEFIFAWSSLSFNMVLLTLHKCENNCRVSLSWVTDDTASHWPRRNFVFPELKERLRVHHCASEDGVMTVNKFWFRDQDTQLYLDGVTKLLNGWRKCVDRVGDCGKSNFVEINNEVWKTRLFWFYSDVFTYFHKKKLRAINFPHTFVQFPPIFWYLPPLRPKYCPQYSILDQPGPMLVPYCETPSFVPV